MGKLVLIYVVSLLLKWGWEVLDNLESHREGGIKGWWGREKLAMGKKALIQVPLCTAWVTGAALGAVNAMSEGVGLGAMDAVGPANTAIAAWMLDSFGKPLARRLKAKEAEP